MVPTELLAIQHYDHLIGLLEKMEDAHAKSSVALLTGSTPTKQARFIRQVFADTCMFSAYTIAYDFIFCNCFC